MSRPSWATWSVPERTALVVAWIAVIGGALARLWALTQRGSLFLDEASLALNVLGRGYADLARPLDWGQAAPVGFLWLERLMAAHAEAPERWLRVVPYLAGASLPWLLWQLGRRVVGTGAGALAAVTAAGSLLAMRYSTEAKPYAMDACVAASLLLCARALLDAPSSARRWWTLGVAALVGVLLSIPSVFVIGGIVMTFVMAAEVRRAPMTRRIGLPWLAAIGAVLAWLWVSAYGAGAASGSLRDYWEPVMLSPLASDRVVRLARVLMELSWIPLRWTASLTGIAIGVALWAGGLGVVLGKRRRDALLLMAPVALAMLASVAGRYPLSDRLAFFAVPGVWVLQAAALIGVRNAFFARRSVVNNARTAAVFVALVAAGIIAWQATDSARFLRAPDSLEPTRPLFAAIDAEAGEVPVYVFARAVPAWLMATHEGAWAPHDARLARWTQLAGTTVSPGYENLRRERAVRAGEGDSLVVTGRVRSELVGLAPGVQYRIAGGAVPPRPSDGWAEEEARRLVAVARPRVWVVASHFFANSPRNELRPLVEAADAAGLQVIEERRAGDDVVALLFSRR